MPRNVRNFWLDIDVDGRTPISAGPKNKGGGFCVDIKVRDEGSVQKVGYIRGFVTSNGDLRIVVLKASGCQQEFRIDACGDLVLWEGKR